MKRFLSLFVAAAIAAGLAVPCVADEIDDDTFIGGSSIGSVGKADFSDYIILEGEELFFEDFESEQTDAVYLPSNEFSVRQDKCGSRALYIAGLSKNLATGNFGPELANCLIEADVMLEGCNAGTNGGFFISARKTSNSAPAYNLLYTDINNYDWENKTWNSTAVRDRLIIARSRGGFNIGNERVKKSL